MLGTNQGATRLVRTPLTIPAVQEAEVVVMDAGEAVEGEMEAEDAGEDGDEVEGLMVKVVEKPMTGHGRTEIRTTIGNVGMTGRWREVERVVDPETVKAPEDVCSIRIVWSILCVRSKC